MSTTPQRPTGAPVSKRASSEAAPLKRSDQLLLPVYGTVKANSTAKFISFNQLVAGSADPSIREKIFASASTAFCANRKTKDVAEASLYNFIIVDHDHDDLDIGTLQQVYDQLNVPYLAYTTSSHLLADEKTGAVERRYRVVVPLAESVDHDTYRHLACGISWFLGCDLAQARSQQVFFLPNKLTEESEYWYVCHRGYPPLDHTNAAHLFLAAVEAGWAKHEIAEQEKLASIAWDAPYRQGVQQVANGNASGVVEKFLEQYGVEEQLVGAGYVPDGRGHFKSPGSESGSFGVNLFVRDGKQVCYSFHGTQDPLSAMNNNGHSLDAFDVYVILSHSGNYSEAVAFIAAAIDPDGQHDRQVEHAVKEEAAVQANISAFLDSISPINEFAKKAEVANVALAAELKLASEAAASAELTGSKGERALAQFDTQTFGRDYDATQTYSWPPMNDGSPNRSGTKFGTRTELVQFLTPWPGEEPYVVSLAKEIGRYQRAFSPICVLAVAMAVAGSYIGGRCKYSNDPEATSLAQTPTVAVAVFAKTGFGKSVLLGNMASWSESFRPAPMNNNSRIFGGVYSLKAVSPQGLYSLGAKRASVESSTMFQIDECKEAITTRANGSNEQTIVYFLMFVDALSRLDGRLQGLDNKEGNQQSVASLYGTLLMSTIYENLPLAISTGRVTGTLNRMLPVVGGSVVQVERVAPDAGGDFSVYSLYNTYDRKMLEPSPWLLDSFKKLVAGKINGVEYKNELKLHVVINGSDADKCGANGKPTVNKIHEQLSLYDGVPEVSRAATHARSLIAITAFTDAIVYGAEVLSDGVLYPTASQVDLSVSVVKQVSESLLREAAGEQLLTSSGEIDNYGADTGCPLQNLVVLPILKAYCVGGFKGSAPINITDSALLMNFGLVSATRLTRNLALRQEFKDQGGINAVKAAITSACALATTFRRATETELSKAGLPAFIPGKGNGGNEIPYFSFDINVLNRAKHKNKKG